MIAELPLKVRPSFDGVFLEVVQPVPSQINEVDQEILDYEEWVHSGRRLHSNSIVY